MVRNCDRGPRRWGIKKLVMFFSRLRSLSVEVRRTGRAGVAIPPNFGSIHFIFCVSVCRLHVNIHLVDIWNPRVIQLRSLTLTVKPVSMLPLVGASNE